ncbi:MAG: ParB N-terminal domain-containing protein [Formosimonas sp.]
MIGLFLWLFNKKGMKMDNSNAIGRLETISIDLLSFDEKNPRFGSLLDENGKMSEDNTIHQMLKKQNIAELMVSISDQGFFSGEPLLVTRNKGQGFTVVEGNRRLTALKILNGMYSHLIPLSIKELVDEAINTPKEIPCLVFNERSDILHYLGYRHITGVKSWGALEKAVYLEQLRMDLMKKYPNKVSEDIFRVLAREIGSKVPTVKQSLTSLALFKHAKDNTFYNLHNLSEHDIQFSLIYTALSYENIANFLGIDTAQNTELNGVLEERAKQLFSWAFVQDQQGRTILGESRNLKKLAAVVAKPDAVNVLIKTQDLDAAYALSGGPGGALSTIIEVVKSKLDQIDNLLNEYDFWPSDSQEGELHSINERFDTLVYRIKKSKKRKNEEGV